MTTCKQKYCIKHNKKLKYRNTNIITGSIISIRVRKELEFKILFFVFFNPPWADPKSLSLHQGKKWVQQNKHHDYDDDKVCYTREGKRTEVKESDRDDLDDHNHHNHNPQPPTTTITTSTTILAKMIMDILNWAACAV